MRLADIIIVSWNGRDDTLQCLESVERERARRASSDVGIIVVDNASTDGLVNVVMRRFPHVRILRLRENRGFTGGTRAGAEFSDAEHLIFLNNDAVVNEGWLNGLLATMGGAAADVIAAAGRIIDYAGGRVDFVGGVMTFDGHAFQNGFRKPLSEATEPASGAELLFACGGNMIVRRENYLILGGFDDDYFAYLEDVDFGWRSWIAGHRIIYAPEATVKHKSSATSDRLGSFERGVLFERNALQTTLKNYDDSLFREISGSIFLTYLHRLHHYARTRNRGAAASLNRAPFGDKSALETRPSDAILDDPLTLMQFRALSWIFDNSARVMEKRQRVQATRKRSDQEIFDRFGLFHVPTYPGDAELFQSSLFAAVRSERHSRFANLEELIQT
ncbi:MAG TPA: glycosyltransferase family 2 protein [Thermoanaerobaculia bacterium]|nr:glycosyltransferase family 2 protein [Thermoanaerobaculia bacterium]